MIKKVFIIASLIVVIGLIVFASYSGVISPATASVTASSMLVIVTAIYVIITRELVRETRNARKQEVLPFFKLQLQPVSMSSYGVKVVNHGNGPATNISLTLTLVPKKGSSKKTVSKEVNGVSPGDFVGFLSPFQGIELSEETSKSYEKIVLEGRCFDVFDEEHKIADEYDLEMLKDPDESPAFKSKKERYLRKEERYLREIKKYLRKISKNLG